MAANKTYMLMQPSEDVCHINRPLTADNFITPDVANKGKQKAKKVYQLQNLLTVRRC